MAVLKNYPYIPPETKRGSLVTERLWVAENGQQLIGREFKEPEVFNRELEARQRLEKVWGRTISPPWGQDLEKSVLFIEADRSLDDYRTLTERVAGLNKEQRLRSAEELLDYLVLVHQQGLRLTRLPELIRQQSFTRESHHRFLIDNSGRIMDAAFRSLDEPFAVEIVSLPPAKLAKLEKFKREKEANLALAEAVTQGGRFGRVYSSLRSTISLIEELSASINLPPEAHNREVELAERKYNQQAGRAERLIDRLRGNPNLREIRAQAIKQAKARISATKRRLLKDRLIALKDHSLCKIPAEQLEALTFPERSLEPFLHLRSLVVSDSEPTDEQIDELIVLFRIWGFDWEELEEIKEKTEKDLKYIEEEMPAGSAPFPSSHITRDFQGIAYYLGVLIDQSQTGSNPTRKTTENLVSLIRGLIRFKCW